MNSLNSLSQISPEVLLVLYVWSLLWKGLALWKAVKNEQRNWFIVILVLSTFGILEIAYLFFFAKKKMKLSEFKFWESEK